MRKMLHLSPFLMLLLSQTFLAALSFDSLNLPYMKLASSSVLAKYSGELEKYDSLSKKYYLILEREGEYFAVYSANAPTSPYISALNPNLLTEYFSKGIVIRNLKNPQMTISDTNISKFAILLHCFLLYQGVDENGNFVGWNFPVTSAEHFPALIREQKQKLGKLKEELAIIASESFNTSLWLTSLNFTYDAASLVFSLFISDALGVLDAFAGASGTFFKAATTEIELSKFNQALSSISADIAENYRNYKLYDQALEDSWAVPNTVDQALSTIIYSAAGISIAKSVYKLFVPIRTITVATTRKGYGLSWLVDNAKKFIQDPKSVNLTKALREVARKPKVTFVDIGHTLAGLAGKFIKTDVSDAYEKLIELTLIIETANKVIDEMMKLLDKIEKSTVETGIIPSDSLANYVLGRLYFDLLIIEMLDIISEFGNPTGISLIHRAIDTFFAEKRKIGSVKIKEISWAFQQEAIFLCKSLGMDLFSSQKRRENVLVLVRNPNAINQEENLVIDFLKKHGYQYTVVGPGELAKLQNPEKFGTIYFRTIGEPIEYKKNDVLEFLKKLISDGANLFTEFYGNYLVEWLGLGKVRIGGWWPVVRDAGGFVKPIDNSVIFEGIPVWDPPTRPDREEQILARLKSPGSYTTVIAEFSKPLLIKFWGIAFTYGWYGQSTESAYCKSWGGCTSERSVHQWAVVYTRLGNGKVVIGSIGGGDNNAVVIGPAGEKLMNNLIRKEW